MFDAEGRMVLFNERFVFMMHFSAPPQKGTSLLSLLTDAKRSGELDLEPEETFESIVGEARAGQSSSKIVATLTGRTLRIAEQPMQGGGWVATHEDVTERQVAEAKIEHMAHHDGLTGLFNRIAFRKRVEDAIPRARRGIPLAIHCLDLDRFKVVNDTLGHPIGDAAVQEVAAVFRSELRETTSWRGSAATSSSSCRTAIGRTEDDAPRWQRGIVELDQPALRSERTPGRDRHQHRHRDRAEGRHRGPRAADAAPTWRSIVPRTKAAAPSASSSRAMDEASCSAPEALEADLRKAVARQRVRGLLPASGRR